MQMTVGDLMAAGAAYDAMGEERRGSAPHSIPAPSMSSAAWSSRNKVAEVKMATGDLAGAIAILVLSRDVLKALIDKEPRPEYLRDLGVSFNRTGDAQRLSGDGPVPSGRYRAGLKIAEFLAAQLPDDSEFAAISASATASSAWLCA